MFVALSSFLTLLVTVDYVTKFIAAWDAKMNVQLLLWLELCRGYGGTQRTLGFTACHLDRIRLQLA